MRGGREMGRGRKMGKRRGVKVKGREGGRLVREKEVR